MIHLGKVLKVRGNKGEVVVEPSPDCELALFKKGEEYLLSSDKYRLRQKLEYMEVMGFRVVLKFNDINSIAQAYKMIGYSISIEGMSPKVKKKHPLIHFTVKDIHGCLWGTVKNVREDGLNPLLEVENNGEVIAVPFNENIVKKIDKAERLVVLDPPEGLLDLNR